MHETTDDLCALQELLDRSYAMAGSHLKSIIAPDRRVGAEELADRLTGMRLLALATATADGRLIVGPVDGIFFRGAFHFGTFRSSSGSLMEMAVDRIHRRRRCMRASRLGACSRSRWRPQLELS